MESNTTFPLGAQLLGSLWPFLAALAICCLALCLICRWMRVGFQWSSLARLHSDQQGGVQSLSFVLTVPLFIFIMLFIVQLSQITIGQIGVEYAAFAGARSAIVWVPAQIMPGVQGEMQVGTNLEFQRLIAYQGDQEVSFNVAAYVNEGFVPSNVTHIYAVYEVAPGGVKYEKIRTAAAMALMNVCPSRQVVSGRTPASASANYLLEPLQKAYVALAPAEASNSRIPARIQNKLEYALEHTQIRIEVRHKDAAAFLDEQDILDDRYEFRLNEVDFQDHVIVDVFHEFALLPGPGRLLARAPSARPGTEVDESYAGGQAKDELAENIQRRYSNTYVYPLRATARLTVEGFKPLQIEGQPQPAYVPWSNQESPAIEPW